MTTKFKLPLDEASAGMILADDLVDSRGNRLLPGKTTLTDGMLASLRKHHVTDVTIIRNDEPDDNQAQAASDAACLKNRIERIDKLFKAHETETLNLQFKQFLINFYSDDHHEKN